METQGELVITKNDMGHIVSVTRQNEEGVILEVLAMSAPIFNQAAPAAVAVRDERAAFEAWWREHVSPLLYGIEADYRFWAIWQARAALAATPAAAAQVVLPEPVANVTAAVELALAHGARRVSAYGKRGDPVLLYPDDLARLLAGVSAPAAQPVQMPPVTPGGFSRDIAELTGDSPQAQADARDAQRWRESLSHVYSATKGNGQPIFGISLCPSESIYRSKLTSADQFTKDIDAAIAAQAAQQGGDKQ